MHAAKSGLLRTAGCEAGVGGVSLAADWWLHKRRVPRRASCSLPVSSLMTYPALRYIDPDAQVNIQL